MVQQLRENYTTKADPVIKYNTKDLTYNHRQIKLWFKKLLNKYQQSKHLSRNIEGA